MKVCTDSCVLGAAADVSGAKRILDIGAGTGLLSLMVAQRSPDAQIEAVEIEAAAAKQAQQNIAASPWAHRMRLWPMALQEFAETQPTPFDAIICNPPFFQASLKSADTAKNRAKHTESLSFSEIISFAQRFLSLEGKLHILLPPHEANLFAQEAQQAGFYTESILWLEATPAGKRLRAIHTYSCQATIPSESILAVREKDHTYTRAFQELLKEYYLIF
jgi:tRNA1Val (adenine37-N6)-methyltransferase